MPRSKFMLEKDMVMVPAEKFRELLMSSVSPEEIVFLKLSNEKLKKDLVELKLTLARAETELVGTKIQETYKRDLCMKLADTLKEGREEHEPDKIKAVERFLRKQGFGAFDSHQIFENSDE